MRSQALLRRVLPALAVVPAALLAFAAVAAPTGTTSPPPSPSTGQPQPSSAAAPATETLTDAEILAMLEAIHNASIDQARSAATRASDNHVKRFAHSVERRAEHAKRREEKLSKRHNLQSAAAGGGVEDFRRTLQQTFHNLEAMTSGPDFDRSYVNDEIAVLNHILTTIDNKLLPNVRMNDLRTEIRTVRDEIEQDLKKAHEVHDRLNKPANK